MLASTALISVGPNPVTVLLCFGLLKEGPTGPAKSARGADMEGRRSRVGIPVAIFTICKGVDHGGGVVRGCEAKETLFGRKGCERRKLAGQLSSRKGRRG